MKTRDQFDRDMRRLDICIAMSRAGMVAGICGIFLPYINLAAGITANVIGIGLIVASVVLGRKVK